MGDKAKAAAAIDGLARQLGATAQQAAATILRQASESIAARVRAMVAGVNGRPVYTIHELLEG
jgi:hypothetical protein